MRRLSILALTALSLALLTGPILAEAGSEREAARQLELLNTDFEALVAAYLGAQPETATFEEHGEGLYSLTIRLPESTRGNLETGDLAEKAKSFAMLATGVKLSAPSSASSLIHSAHADVRFDYTYWWVAVNTGNSDVSAKTDVKLKGPGRKLNFSQDLSYPKGAIKIYFVETNDGVGKTGVYTLIAKAAGGGAAKIKMYAD